MKYLLPLLFPCVLFSCQSKEMELPEDVKKLYFEATKTADECSDLLSQYRDEKNMEDFVALYAKLPELTFDFNHESLNEEQYQHCRNKKRAVDSLKREVKQVIDTDLSLHNVTISQEMDKLINSTFSVPFHAKRGEDLKLKAYSSNPYNFKIYNADSRQLIYNSRQQRDIDDVIHINNSAIYLLEFTSQSPIYIDFSLTKKAMDILDLVNKEQVCIDTVPCTQGDFRAQKVVGVKLRNLFEEPRKITLRSQGKALFSGSCRSLVALNLPAGCTDAMYNLRISTSDSDRSSDGEFYDRTNTRYHEIRFLGLPLYESSRNNNSLLRELLSVSKPDREEEAYCSMYVFKTAGEARKFQNNKAINSLQYNLDYSIVGTQSCNGRIPTQGMKTLYLGFDNPKMTSSVYIWLEVVSAVKTTEYFKETYVIKK